MLKRKLTAKELEKLVSLCDTSDLLIIGKGTLILSMPGKKNKTTRQLYPGGPKGEIIDENIVNGLVWVTVAFKTDEVREWAQRRLSTMEEG